MKILISIQLLIIYFSMSMTPSSSLASIVSNKTEVARKIVVKSAIKEKKISKTSKVTPTGKTTKAEKQTKQNQKLSSKSLEQKMVFNDRLVNGKHQVPGAGIVTVENEKSLLNLISIRTDFKDRRAKELQRD